MFPLLFERTIYTRSFVHVEVRLGSWQKQNAEVQFLFVARFPLENGPAACRMSEKVRADR